MSQNKKKLEFFQGSIIVKHVEIFLADFSKNKKETRKGIL